MQDKLRCFSGLDVETTRALAATGARVYGFALDLEAAKTACASSLEPRRVELIHCDLSSQASVRAAADEFKTKSSKLDVMVCNAAVMSVPERELSIDGFEVQLAKNYLGHFLLFHLLRAMIMESSNSGVSTPSGAGKTIQHRSHLNLRGVADQHFGTQGAHSLSLMTSGIRSKLLQHIPTAYIEKVMAKSESLPKSYKSPEQGAATTLMAAVGREYEWNGGLYLEDCAVATTDPLIPIIRSVNEYLFVTEKQDRLFRRTLQILKLDDSSA
ncbi:hypothetical protein GGS21DRAFT_540053 [Xylaria nigripes]|nr:hypothetical protein GGS21DRAFT_540053 [Xylaria nigripes]